MELSSSTFFFAFIGGILPAALWLWFWLYEDKVNPEPRQLIFATFCAGMVATLVALVFQNSLRPYFPAISTTGIPLISQFVSLFIWATTEEIAKFAAAYFIVLRRPENDEPIDNMVYLITVGLGFAALENALYLLDPIRSGNLVQTLIIGDLRFIGTSLLHLVTSASIGILMAFAFCKPRKIKRWYILMGLVLAILLHTFFNFFIIVNGNNLFPVFSLVWLAVIILLLFFEKAKQINRTCIYEPSEETKSV